MAAYRASLTIDVGSNASFDALAQITSDLKIVLDFAQDVQAVIDRNDASYQVLRRRDFGPIIDEFDFAPGRVRSEFLAALITSGSPVIRSASFERAVDQRLSEIAVNRVIRVESISYENPFDFKVKFDGGGIAKILEIIRDWGADRRQANARAVEAEARARRAEARTSSYEDDLQFKRDVQEAVRRGLASGELRIGNDDTQTLLTVPVQRALGYLLQANLEAEIESSNDESESLI